MEYRALGASGLFVSDFCLGTMIFGEKGGRGADPATATRLIHLYLDAGGNHIDTANVYAEGEAEAIVGKALQGRRQEVILATKVYFPRQPGPNQSGLSRHNLLNTLHQSLRSLQTDYIDLLYLHCWDPFTPLEETLRTLEDVVRAGKVRYLGLSNFKAWQAMKAICLSQIRDMSPFVAAQYQYSLVKRDIEYEFLDLFAEEKLSLMPWGPLGGGFLTGKYRRHQAPDSFKDGRIGGTPDEHEESWQRRNTPRNWDILDAVGATAVARGASFAQIALAWLRSRPFVGSVLIGARTEEQLADNLKAASLSLNAEEIAALDRASALPELYPYRMIEAYARKKP
jgi:aryl-alcohol dehydrogenase-like predicted oxidoreductase